MHDPSLEQPARCGKNRWQTLNLVHNIQYRHVPRVDHPCFATTVHPRAFGDVQYFSTSSFYSYCIP